MYNVPLYGGKVRGSPSVFSRVEITLGGVQEDEPNLAAAPNTLSSEEGKIYTIASYELSHA